MVAKKAPEGRAAIASARSQTRAQMLPGLVWAFRFYADGVPEELAVDQPIADHLDGWLWLHFDSAGSDVSQFLGSKLPSSAVELLITTDDHQQLHADEACAYGVFADLVGTLGSPAREIGFLHFAMTERLLVTNRRNALDAVEATREAVRKGRKIGTAAALLGAIVEHVADAVDTYAEDLAGSLDDIEERILADERSDERVTLGHIRRATVRLHRQLAMSRSLINRIECISEPSIPLELPTEKLGQRLEWLDSEVVALRDRAHLLQEEISLKIAEHTNRHVEVLTIVATVLLPATLVAGIFGMNVKGLPLTENSYGFIWSMGILIGASALVYWLLKRSGTVGR